MAKTPDYAALAAVADGDLFTVVDVSDATQSADGSTKKLTAANLASGAPFTSRYVELADTSTSGFGFVVDEDDMASNSATKVPTQQSVKAYVDASGGGAVNLTETELTGTSETLALVHNGQLLRLNNASPITLEVPLNATVAFPIGAQVLGYYADGQATIVAEGGVTIVVPPSGSLTVPEENAIFVLTKRDTNTWLLTGTTAPGPGAVAEFSDAGWVKIDEETLASSSATHVFSEGGGDWSVYKALRVTCVNVKDTRTDANAQSITMQFNADSGSNYGESLMRIVSNGSDSATELNLVDDVATYIRIGYAPSSFAGHTTRSGMAIATVSQGSTYRKYVISQFSADASAATETMIAGVWQGVWRSAAEITSITLGTTDTGDFVAGSQFILEGLV
jgi:hypothetical protein